MSFATPLLKQTLTYWGNPVPNGFGGSTFEEPVTIKGRWQDQSEVFVDTAGEEQVSHAVVFTEEALEENGFLYLGESTEEAPTSVAGAWKIRRTGNSPSLDAQTDLKKIWL